MAGDEEVRARATLAEMAMRISRGPYIALGVAELTTPGQVRAAFLELTKRFHPARFGRMSPDVQRQSNEVFLGIKNAHETLMRSLGVSTKPGRTTPSGPIPAIAAEGSQAMPVAARTSTGPLPRATAAGTQAPAVRPGSPPLARAGSPPARPGTPPHDRVSRAPTPAFGIPLMRPGTPPQARPGSPPAAREPAAPRAPAVQFDEQAGLDVAKAHLVRRDWANARHALQELAARVPQSKVYRALLCYARGREAQTAGKVEDAALEFQRALQLDPDLRDAKSALAEIQRKR